MADAAYLISLKASKNFTGNSCVDEDVLQEHGVTDFSKHAIDPNENPIKDIFLPGADYEILKAQTSE